MAERIWRNRLGFDGKIYLVYGDVSGECAAYGANGTRYVWTYVDWLWLR